MGGEVDAFDVALGVAQVFEGSGVPYAIGGAIAYALWGPPRGTMDVDLNLFVPPDRVAAALEPLRRFGARFDSPDVGAEAAESGMVVGRVGPFRLDIFTPSIPFAWEAMHTRQRAKLRDQEAWFLSAEATCVFKLLFFRGKDVVDLERLVAMQKSRLDTAYVRRWTVEMMGEADERVLVWDGLVRAQGA